jgi:hypothetical protein
MGLGISFEESYKPITSVMDDSADTDLASVLTMSVVMLQDNNWLFLALAGMLDIASVKITIVAVVSTNRTKAFLFGQ